jgi:hypothetical protein
MCLSAAVRTRVRRPEAESAARPMRRVRSVVAALAVAAAIVAVPGTASSAPTTVGYDVFYLQYWLSLPPDRALASSGQRRDRRPAPTHAWPASSAVHGSPQSSGVPAAGTALPPTANPGEALTHVPTWPKTKVEPIAASRRSSPPRRRRPV